MQVVIGLLFSSLMAAATKIVVKKPPWPESATEIPSLVGEVSANFCG
jgi:hypothetical protein